jgi:hypothetical protein
MNTHPTYLVIVMYLWCNLAIATCTFQGRGQEGGCYDITLPTTVYIVNTSQAGTGIYY